jgi:hypothetical protein
MTFYEGTSKVELKDDNSVLPHDVPYKGTTTNELVFMLTNTNKKIRSGADMNRAEAYAAIKANNLQSECVKRFGKNFTVCKTADLVALVNEKTVKAAKSTKTTRTEATAVVVDTKARAAISRLLAILHISLTLDSEEVEEIEGILGGRVVAASEDYAHASASPYSDDEIDEMFKFTK